MDDENGHPTKPGPDSPTPEVARLLKLLEIQSESRRSRLPVIPSGLHGDSFRYGSLIVIVVFALGSVWFMEWMVSQLPRPRHPAGAAPGLSGTAAHGSGTPGGLPGASPKP